MNTLAPIILFVYARPEHTRKTLEALANNNLANKSNLIIYSDAARDDSEIELVNAVRCIVNSATGFLNVTVIEREKNYGLARNIIEGVTEVCSNHNKVIVVEDDIVTNPYFLTFMNQSLDKYVNEPSVWHISGWNYPITTDELGDVFFWRVMNCWGWATWANRWQNFEKEPENLIRDWSRKQIYKFNLDGTCKFWQQVQANKSGNINTWAIFWYATIFKNNGLCLNPVDSLVTNIGHDGSGHNSGEIDFFKTKMISVSSLILPDKITESELAVIAIKTYVKNNLFVGFFNRISKIIRNIFRS